MDRVRRRYARAPVVEAVLSVAFEQLPYGCLDKLESVTLALGARFPIKEPRYQASFQVNLGASLGTAAERRQDGWLLKSSAGNRLAQVSLSSVSVHLLYPYSNWEMLEKELQGLWSSLAAAVDVVPKKVGVRYVNRLDVPIGTPLDAYVKCYPEVPDNLASLDNFYLRMDLSIEGATVVVQEGFVPSPIPDCFAIMLDNDLTFDLREPGSLWSTVSRARDVKNYVFESCITDEMRRRIS